MKNIFRFIIISYTVFFTSIPGLCLAAQKEIILASDYWCPYSCMPNTKYSGYLVELAEKVFESYGIKVKYKLMPWVEAITDAKEGRIDGVIGISNGEEDLVVSKTPLVYSTIGAFTKEDSDWVYDGIESLNGKRITMVFGYDLGDTIRRHISRNYPINPRLFIIEMGNEGVIDSINNLLDKKADIYVEDEAVVNHYLKNKHIHGIKNSGKINEAVFPIYIAFSSKSLKTKNYIKMFEDALQSLKDTGDLDDLKKKYNIPP